MLSLRTYEVVQSEGRMHYLETMKASYKLPHYATE